MYTYDLSNLLFEGYMYYAIEEIKLYTKPVYFKSKNLKWVAQIQYSLTGKWPC